MECFSGTPAAGEESFMVGGGASRGGGDPGAVRGQRFQALPVLLKHGVGLQTVLQTLQLQREFARPPGGQAVDHPLLVAAGGDESVAAEEGEVFRDGDLRQLQGLLEVADTERLPLQQMQDPQAGFVAQAAVNRDQTHILQQAYAAAGGPGQPANPPAGKKAVLITVSSRNRHGFVTRACDLGRAKTCRLRVRTNPTTQHLMAKLPMKWLALLGSAVLTAGGLFAQDSKALIDALVKKGILTNDEAKQIAAEVSKSETAMDVATSGSKNLKKLTLSGRFQTQFVDMGASIDGAAANPVPTGHFFLRRMYLGAKADFINGWSGNLNYDFANASFDAAFMEWKQSDQMILDIGFRKAPIGLEEWATSSGSLKAIERSPVTRYFVESNNGRRLGAGSYRTGVYLGGSNNGFTYNFAVTNSERDEFSSLNGNSDPGVQGGGSAANNTPSWWGNLGYGGKFTGGTYKVGLSTGYLPDQGGLTLGKGDNLTVYSAYGVVTAGGWDLEAEYWWGDDDHGVSATQSAKPTGYFIQPAYRVGEWEAVVRYTAVDSDHRGVNISDGTRSAPSGGTMDKMEEWYAGLNWYIVSNDVKFQIGFVHSESKDTVTGGAAKAKADGVRSQMQINF